MRLLLYQPDIPQNTGTLLRLAACLGLAIDLIEPCGFVLEDRRLRRAGMDYLDGVELVRHRSWQAYCDTAPAGTIYPDSGFTPPDRRILGREPAGVPERGHGQAAPGCAFP